MRDIRRYRTAVSQCVQSDLPPPSMFNRYIYCALLLTGIAQINVKLYLRCAQCMLKQDSQLYLKVRTLTTHIVRLRGASVESSCRVACLFFYFSNRALAPALKVPLVRVALRAYTGGFVVVASFRLFWKLALVGRCTLVFFFS